MRPVRRALSRAPIEYLDLATVIKVSQAVSGEIVFGKLIETLMRIAIEQAGAERGLLILPRGSAQRIVAEGHTAGDTVIVQSAGRARDRGRAAGIGPPLCRTHRESLILDDAVAQSAFAADPYVREAPSSLHSMPTIDQSDQARRHAVPRKQPGPPRLRAGSDGGAEAPRVAGGDRAGEHPSVP